MPEQATAKRRTAFSKENKKSEAVPTVTDLNGLIGAGTASDSRISGSGANVNTFFEKIPEILKIFRKNREKRPFGAAQKVARRLPKRTLRCSGIFRERALTTSPAKKFKRLKYGQNDFIRSWERNPPILSKKEALSKGFRVDEHTHYHGLWEKLYLKIIDGLDGVSLAYRGTLNALDSSRRENYFLLVSQYKDKSGNTINVPVYVNEKGQYNQVFIETNKIATVFGRKRFLEYIQNEVRNGNLVRKKTEALKPVNWQHQLLTVIIRMLLRIV